MDAKLRASRERPHGSAGGEDIRRHRMRFSVRVRTQNASFRRVRFSSPGQTSGRLTERRILQPAPHEKAHSGLINSRKSALYDPQIAQTAPFRDVAVPGRCGATPRQAAGHYGEWLNWANALEQPPASLRGGLRGGPQISVWSLASRKGALCLTGGFRMRFSVRVHAQNALFRRMRLSSSGQTRRLLTEKRILQPASHGKTHSATVVLPKSALCDTPLEVRSHGVRLSVRNGDTHPRHTRRLLTSQTHKAGHPSPHCHLILNVPVLHVHHRVAV